MAIYINPYNFTDEIKLYAAESDGQKSPYKFTPNFEEIASLGAGSSDDILFKFGSVKSDWEKDGLRLAWKKRDLCDDKYNNIIIIAIRSIYNKIIITEAHHLRETESSVP